MSRIARKLTSDGQLSEMVAHYLIEHAIDQLLLHRPIIWHFLVLRLLGQSLDGSLEDIVAE